MTKWQMSYECVVIIYTLFNNYTEYIWYRDLGLFRRRHSFGRCRFSNSCIIFKIIFFFFLNIFNKTYKYKYWKLRGIDWRVSKLNVINVLLSLQYYTHNTSTLHFYSMIIYISILILNLRLKNWKFLCAQLLFRLYRYLWDSSRAN